MGSYLVAVSPIPGHVMPLLQVGADLSARGHRVSVLTGPYYRDWVDEHGMAPLELPPQAHPVRPVIGSARQPSLVARWRCGRADMRSVFIDPLPAQYAAVRDAVAAERFDAVLCDVAFTGALPLLTDDRPRPWVVVCGVGPLTISSVDTPPFGMGWVPRPATTYRAMTWAVHHVLFADVQAHLNRTLGTVGAPRSPVFLTDWPLLADRTLQFTVPGMEFSRTDLPATVTFTGPVIATPPQRQHTVDLEELSRVGRAVVHVTQGTWDNDDLDALIRPTLDALADRDDVVVVATTGRPGTTLSGPLPANAVLTDYLPYTELLPHVDVMITNGGYGGVHHALSHGVPLIMAGFSADKPDVAARVTYAGAGTNLGTSRPTPKAIAEAVDHVLGCADYRTAAQKLSEEIAAADAFERIAEVLAGLPTAGGEYFTKSGTLLE